MLRQQPQFIKRYLQLKRDMDPDDRRELISHRDWVRIVAIRPELLRYAPSRRFSSEEWELITAKQPQLRPKRLAKGK